MGDDGGFKRRKHFLSIENFVNRESLRIANNHNDDNQNTGKSMRQRYPGDKTRPHARGGGGGGNCFGL